MKKNAAYLEKRLLVCRTNHALLSVLGVRDSGEYTVHSYEDKTVRVWLELDGAPEHTTIRLYYVTSLPEDAPCKFV